MIKQTGFLVLVLATALLAGERTQAAVPHTVNFTARVTEADEPITGVVAVNLKIFDAASGGNQLWEESFPGVTADNGLLYLTLGNTTPLDGAVFGGSAVYLELTIEGDTLGPRITLESVPYAIRAGTAEAVADSASVITGVTAGPGLAGGGGSGDVTLSLNIACQPGSALNSLNPDGSPNCLATTGTGGISTVTANNGLTGGGSTATVTVGIATGGVTTARLADNAVTSIKITDGAVATADLADDAVTSIKITDGAVTTAKIADNAVTTGKIVDGTIATADLANNAVTTVKINDGAVTMAKTSGPVSTAVFVSGNGTGTQDSFIPAVAMPSAGACLVTAWAGLTNNESFRLSVIARPVGGAITASPESANAQYNSPDYAANHSFVFNVTAASWQFGCRTVPSSGGNPSGTITCRINYLCN